MSARRRLLPPGSAKASPARPRPLAITLAVPNGEDEILSQRHAGAPFFHSPGDIASW